MVKITFFKKQMAVSFDYNLTFQSYFESMAANLNN